MIDLALTLRQAGKLYLLSIKQTFVIAFLIALCNQLLDWQLVNTVSMPGDAWQADMIFALLGIVMLVVRLFGDGLIYCRQYFQLHGQPQPLLPAVYYLLKRFYKLFLAGTLVILILFAAMIALASILMTLKWGGPGVKILIAIAWMLIVTLFYFYVPLILFANKNVFDALKISVVAARHTFPKTFFLMLLGALLEILPIYFIIFIGGNVDSETSGFGLEQTLVVVLLAFILPFTSALILSWYQRVFQRLT